MSVHQSATPSNLSNEIERIILDNGYSWRGLEQLAEDSAKALTTLFNKQIVAELKAVIDKHEEIKGRGEIPILMLIIANRIEELNGGADFGLAESYHGLPEGKGNKSSDDPHKELERGAERTNELELLQILDDIANKPWRAIRHIAEMFENNLAEDPEWYAECAREYRKLEAFYSNGGNKKIDELLADPAFNKNHPQYYALKADTGVNTAASSSDKPAGTSQNAPTEELRS